MFFSLFFTRLGSAHAFSHGSVCTRCFPSALKYARYSVYKAPQGFPVVLLRHTSQDDFAEFFCVEGCTCSNHKRHETYIHQQPIFVSSPVASLCANITAGCAHLKGRRVVSVSRGFFLLVAYHITLSHNKTVRRATPYL